MLKSAQLVSALHALRTNTTANVVATIHQDGVLSITDISGQSEQFYCDSVSVFRNNGDFKGWFRCDPDTASLIRGVFTAIPAQDGRVMRQNRFTHTTAKLMQVKHLCGHTDMVMIPSDAGQEYRDMVKIQQGNQTCFDCGYFSQVANLRHLLKYHGIHLPQLYGQIGAVALAEAVRLETLNALLNELGASHEKIGLRLKNPKTKSDLLALVSLDAMGWIAKSESLRIKCSHFMAMDGVS